MSTSKSQFVPRVIFEQLCEALKTGSETLNAAKDKLNAAHVLLSDYHKFLRLRDRAYPLLLADGESLRLHREPTYLYLLPPISLDPNTERWILVQYPARPGWPPQVQLLTWGIGQNRATLNPLGAPKAVEVQEEPRLDRRCNEITMAVAGPAITIVLRYPKGSLCLSAMAKLGIITQPAWDPTPDISDERFERHAYGKMATILRIGRGNEDWPDNRLFDKDGRQLEHKLGRINGADSPERHPDRIFLASSRAKVFCLRTDTEKVLESPTLGGAIHDTLAVSGTGYDDGDNSTALAAAYDGCIYLLRESEAGDRLEVKHWQEARNHISRLMGNGQGRLLALDQHHTIHPLVVNRPGEVGKLRGRSMLALFEAFAFDKKNDDKLWDAAIEICAGDDDKFTRISRLILERYLHHLRERQSAISGKFNPEPFIYYFLALADYGPANVFNGTSSHRARLHLELQKRVWDWMKTAVLSSDTPSSPIQYDPDALQPLWVLLTPPTQAPDWFLMSMFRRYDWGEAWMKRHRIAPAGPANAWLQEVRTQRRRLLPAMHRLRPLTVRGSMRFGSQARHIRALNPTKRLYVMVEYKRGVQVVRIPEEPTKGWERIAALTPAAAKFSGLPMSMAAGPELNQSLAAEDLQADHLLIGTDRGEIDLYRVRDGEFYPVREPQKIPLEIMSSQLITTFPKPGIVFGGQTPDRQPALYWLPLPTGDARVVWTGDNKEKGCLRMLAWDEGEHFLWGVDREGGRLRRWKVTPAATAIRVEPQADLEFGQKLYCLGLSDNKQTVLCGGQDGQALAVESRSGRLRWNAGCGNVIRRVMHLPADASSSGLWVVCGDHDHALMIDDEGRLNGVLEAMGPVTAICRFEDHGLLLGCLDGRLILVSNRPPEESEAEQAPPLAPPDESSLAWSPLQYHHALAKGIVAIDPGLVQEVLGQGLVYDESLTSLALMDLAIRTAPQGGGASLAEGLNSFLHPANDKDPQPPTRVAWLIAQLVQAKAKETLPALAQKLWEFLGHRDPDTILCQMLNPMLRQLEEAATSQPPAPPEDMDLLRKINNCLWSETRPDDSCHPEQLAREERLKVIRSSQMLRHWVSTRNPDPESEEPAVRINYWCASLTIIWGIDTSEELRRRLKVFFTQQPLLHKTEKDRWLDWLVALVIPEAKSPPPPLNTLLTTDCRPWTDGMFKELQLLWPGKDWPEWLAQLQAHLRSLADARERAPHVAWRERQELLALEEHFYESWDRRFTVANGHPLLALWGPGLRSHWEQVVQARLNSLRESAFGRQGEYLSISPKIKWHGSKAVELILDIRNLNPHSLHFERATWNNEPIIPTKVADEFPASDQCSQLILRLTADAPDILDGTLDLHYKDIFDGTPLHRPLPITDKRVLTAFTAEPGWHPTWARLQSLMEGAEAEGRPFLWLDGHVWPSEERQRLKAMIRDKFPRGAGCIKDLTSLATLPPGAEPIFCPDLALGADDSAELVEQLQPLFQKPDRTSFSFLALAVWRRRHPFDEAIQKPLEHPQRLPDESQVTAFLFRLFGAPELVEMLEAGLASLPDRALGAWCSGDALYIGQLAAAGEELYAPPASLLSDEVWQALDAGHVPPAIVASWLSQDNEISHLQLHDRNIFRAHWPNGQKAFSIPQKSAQKRELQQLVTSLLRTIISRQKSQETAEEFLSVGCITFTTTLTIQHEIYERCYAIFPPATSASIKANLDQPPGVWLNFDPFLTLPQLPGIILTMDRDACLRLIHVETKPQAMLILNEIAASQQAIPGGKVFRVGNGMTPDGIKHHFGYRKEALDGLWGQLHNADQGAPSATLIIGGRRIGKTSLRQRFIHELTEREPERACFMLDFQKIVVDSRESLSADKRAMKLEYEFIQILHTAMATGGSPMAREWRQFDNPRQRDRTRQALEKHLDTLNQRRGMKTVFFFDETDHLSRPDAISGHEIFRYLRGLVTEKKICLFATIYPFGAHDRGALNISRYNTGASTYNFFDQTITLPPWEPDQAWNYLVEKLAGFGLVLPGSLREEMLQVCRGVPWIVHALGLALCQGKKPGRRQVILRDEWRTARKKALEEVHAEILQTVRAEAEKSDRGHSGAGTGRTLGGGYLWRGLVALARNRDIAIPPPGGEWPAPPAFTLDELSSQLGNGSSDRNRLHRALDRFAGTALLAGDPVDDERYYFANNLLPAWVALTQGGLP